MPVKSNDIAMEPVSTDDWDNSLYSEFDWNDLNLCEFPKLDYPTHPDEFDFIPMEPMQSPKQQIRHHDCMWSGTCVDKSHPGKMKFCSANAAASAGTSSNSATTATSTTATTNTTAAASVKTTAATNINGLNINSNNNNISKINNNNNNSTAAATATILNNKMNTIKAQQIPAGRSLLLNSRLNQKHNNNNNNSNYNNNTNNQQQHNNINTMICDGGGGGDGNNNYYKQQKPQQLQQQQQQQQHLTRPDTPLSLDDDVPEFKHEINTTTPECPITGSGRMQFIPETMTSSQIISMLREHLEDDTRNLDIGSIINTVTSAPKENTFLDILTDLKYLSDYEELDEDSAIDMDSGDSDNTDNIHYNNGLLLQQQCQQQLQQEQQQQYNHHTDLLSHQIKTEIDDDCDYDDEETLHKGSIMSSRMITNGNTNTNSYDSHVGDHSYTKPEKEKRPKNRVDTHKFGIDTPSDSDEEIDVVSVTDKTLPTNPSARDRRALQTTVAHKISAAARMNKSASGAMQQQQQKSMRSISQQQTPRRRCSDDDDDMLSTTSTSSSHSMTNGGGGTTMKLNHRNYNHQQSLSSSSSPNSGYVSSSSSSNCNYNSNYKYTMQQSSTISSTSSSAHNNTTTQSGKMSGGTASRKRQQHQITSKDSYSSKMHSSNSSHNSSKRNRSKKQKMSSSNGHSLANQTSSSSSPNKRMASDTDEADTLEKRNLHNDMERQRRIGLKNLFEELKAQIPSIRDKERAPKVNILREAAALCNKLSRDNEQHVMLKKQQNRLIARVKHLRTSLATQRRC